MHAKTEKKVFDANINKESELGETQEDRPRLRPHYPINLEERLTKTREFHNKEFTKREEFTKDVKNKLKFMFSRLFSINRDKNRVSLFFRNIPDNYDIGRLNSILFGMNLGIDFMAAACDEAFENPNTFSVFNKKVLEGGTSSNALQKWVLALPVDERRNLLSQLREFNQALLREIDLECGLNEIMETNQLTQTTQEALERMGNGTGHNVYNQPVKERKFIILPADILSRYGFAPETSLLAEEEKVSAEDVKQGLEKAHTLLSSGYARRRPIRLSRIMKAFETRETDPVFLEEIAKEFEEGTTDPRKSAASAISWLNKTFEEQKIPLEIQTLRLTAYRFRSRPLD